MPLEPASASRDEQLALLLASPPPRSVPRELLRAASRQTSSGPTGWLGFVFLLMSLLFFGIFAPWEILQDWRLSASQTATAPGQVISVDRTGLSVNKQRVMRYEFAFQTREGMRMRGECFTTGARWLAGETVTVRFSVSHPELCCIEGARLGEAGGVGLIVVPFLAFGLGLVVSVFVRRCRTRWLLENGAVTEATVVGFESTAVQINRQTVYRITLQRSDPATGAPFVLRKYQPAQVGFARQRFESKQPVFVLYDPAHPKRALLPEAL